MEKKTLEEVKEGIQKRMNIATEKLLEIIEKNYEAILETEDNAVGEWFYYDIADWIGLEELTTLLQQGAKIKNLEKEKERENMIQKIQKLSYDYPDIAITKKDKKIEITGNPKTGNIFKVVQKMREEKICEGDQMNLMLDFHSEERGRIDILHFFIK